MQLKRWMVFRPNLHPLTTLPLNVRSAGGYEVPAGWQEPPRKKWFTQLFWIASGILEFRTNRGWTPAKANDLFIYHPGEIHEIRVPEAASYFWLTFDHVDSARWMDGFGFSESPFTGGPCPGKLFQRIRRALRNGTPEGERQAAGLAHALLLAASSQVAKPESSPLVERARRWLDENYADPRFGVHEVATGLSVHRSTLFRLFRAHYGLTPSLYLQNLRRQKALSLLQGTRLPINEVAWKSGFSDPNYFSRTIKEATGLSPREFRAG